MQIVMVRLACETYRVQQLSSELRGLKDSELLKIIQTVGPIRKWKEVDNSGPLSSTHKIFTFPSHVLFEASTVPMTCTTMVMAPKTFYRLVRARRLRRQLRANQLQLKPDLVTHSMVQGDITA